MSVLKLIPRATEKAYSESLRSNTYTFNVPQSSNKQQISRAVEEQFSVNVIGVRTIIHKGKAIRFSRGANRFPGNTMRSDVKKAYVTLKEGDSISVFDNVTEAEEA